MKQQGFLMVAAVILMVIVSLLIAGIVALFLRTTAGSGALQAIPQAAALATTAIEQGRKTLSNQSTCATLNNKRITLSTGTAMTASTLTKATSYLTQSILAGGPVETIYVNDSRAYAPSGLVLIGREVFYYRFIASPTELGGVSRAQNSSIATSHPQYDFVTQYQCAISGTGTSTVNPSVSAQRQYTQFIQQPMVFAVAGGSVWAWNQNDNHSWASWQANDPEPKPLNLEQGNFNMLSVSMLNYNEGWAVGPGYIGDIAYYEYPPGALLYAFYQLSSSFNPSSPKPANPNTHAPAASGFPFQSQQYVVSLGTSLFSPIPQLQSVDATTSSEAWAVGSARVGSGPFILMRWTAKTGWGLAGLYSSLYQKAQTNFLLSIKMINIDGSGFANFGYIVGGTPGNQPLIYSYHANNGPGVEGVYSEVTGIPSEAGRLMSVDITPFRVTESKTIESFFAGFNSISGGVLLRCTTILINNNITTVCPQTSTATKPLHQVSVIDTQGDGIADFGCAVGEGGTVIFFGPSLTVTKTFTLGTNIVFTSVALLSPDDIWVGGYEGSTGVLFHYDGTTWTQDTSIADPITGMSKVPANSNALSPLYETIN